MTDLVSTVATLQSVVQGVTHVRRLMRRIQARSGLSVDESVHSTDTDRQLSIS